MGIIAKIRLGF